jgi:hypothetical protein
MRVPRTTVEVDRFLGQKLWITSPDDRIRCITGCLHADLVHRTACLHADLVHRTACLHTDLVHRTGWLKPLRSSSSTASLGMRTPIWWRFLRGRSDCRGHSCSRSTVISKRTTGCSRHIQTNIQGIKASRHQGIKASRHQGIKASRHQGIKASRHQPR